MRVPYQIRDDHYITSYSIMQETDSRVVSLIPSLSEVKKRSKDGNGEIYSFFNALCMNGGNGVYSYAFNSLQQQRVILQANKILVENTREMITDLDFPRHIKMADFGCSSGENTFLALSQIVNTIHLLCEENGRTRPEIECCLNDLLDNDFNTTFSFLPFFHKNLNLNNGSCFVYGVPGSFYSKIFPSNTLHFVHSSYSIHWLSKVPKGLENNGERSVYITSSSPLSVYKAYLNQFQNDFSLFLRLRSEEMVPKGRMVLTLIGRSSSDPLYRDSNHFWTLLSMSLLDLVSEGVVSGTQMDSFKIPFYDPNEEEVREIVEKEGSFVINQIQNHEYYLLDSKTDDGHDGHGHDDDDDDGKKRRKRLERGKRKANYMRAVCEPMVVAHFGQAIMDRLFVKYAHHAAHHADCSPVTCVNLVLSLTKL